MCSLILTVVLFKKVERLFLNIKSSLFSKNCLSSCEPLVTPNTTPFSLLSDEIVPLSWSSRTVRSVTTTIVLKHNEWVIGHVSLKTKKERAELLHLFVDSKYRKKGLGLRLLKETESLVIDSKIESITAKVQKKNLVLKKILERSGYRYKNSNQNLMIKKLE